MCVCRCVHYSTYLLTNLLAFTITQNALILQLLDAATPRPPSGGSSPAPPLWHSPYRPPSAPTRSSGSATDGVYGTTSITALKACSQHTN